VKRVRAGVLYPCKGAHTLFTGQGERERGEEREGEREKKGWKERKRERERKRKVEREKDRERERCRICLELFLFLKRMMGALAPFSYLVKNNNLVTTINIKRGVCIAHY
jgi:hypothetical protein